MMMCFAPETALEATMMAVSKRQRLEGISHAQFALTLPKTALSQFVRFIATATENREIEREVAAATLQEKE